MKATNLIKAIEKLGGTAELKTTPTAYGEKKEVVGTLNNHDIQMHGEEQDFYTVRSFSKRGTYDPNADYNSGDWTFCNRINELAWATGLN